MQNRLRIGGKALCDVQVMLRHNGLLTLTVINDGTLFNVSRSVSIFITLITCGSPLLHDACAPVRRVQPTAFSVCRVVAYQGLLLNSCEVGQRRAAFRTSIFARFSQFDSVTGDNRYRNRPIVTNE